MKKILTIISTVLMMLCFGVTAFATGSFTSSPGAKQEPSFVGSENASADCKAEIVITAYANRNTLETEAKAEIEAAYNTIASTSNLGTLGYGVNVLASSLGIDTDALFVSDLFGVSYDNCDEHALHKEISVTIEPSLVSNYVGVMCYKNGDWKLVEDAKLENGDLTFSVDEPAPFAIVVHDGSVGAVGNVPSGAASDAELKLLAAAVVAVSMIIIAIVAGKIRNS